MNAKIEKTIFVPRNSCSTKISVLFFRQKVRLNFDDEVFENFISNFRHNLVFPRKKGQ